MRMGFSYELGESIDGENLESVTQFKYLEATITEEARSV